MTWSRRFDMPIDTGVGKPLATLRDAAAFIQKLKPAEQKKPHWLTATRILIATAEGRDFPMHAEIAVRKALASA